MQQGVRQLAHQSVRRLGPSPDMLTLEHLHGSFGQPDEDTIVDLEEPE